MWRILRLSGRGRRTRSASSGFLKPATKKAAVGVVVALVAIISLLSFINVAGPTGRLLLQGERSLVGWFAYVLPLFLGLISLGWIFPQRFILSSARWAGIVLTVVGSVGLLHVLVANLDTSLQVAVDGGGGGYLGFLVSYPLSVALSRVAAGFIFFGAAAMGIFLAFNISPVDIWQWLRLFKAGDEDSSQELEEAGTYEAEVPRFRVNTMQTPEAVKPDVVQLKRQQQLEEQQKQRAREVLRSANRAYQPPPLDLLHSAVGRPNSGNIKENAQKIKRTLEQFGILVTMGEVNVGPTVTQYTLRPDEGVKLSRITGLQNDLALALAAHPLRIEAPIPGKTLVGIEIPNREVSLVRLRDLLGDKTWRGSESPLTFALGKDVAGLTIVDTLERMPHLLIAGATGSGKSVSINTLLLSLLYRNSPSVMRMILVDPKRVELIAYDGIPHLLTPVIVDPEKTVNALKWLVKEMERRYQVLSDSRARNLLSYNTNNPETALPLIAVVIDELADLMMKYAREVEAMIVRLSQMARAVGIHLVLATQRPSVNVITGLIKANIPARIAFHVASQIDSRTILDAAGAEKLLGNGDMLYLSGETAKPRRIQGAFVSEEEVHRVVAAIKENTGELDYDDSIVATARTSMGMSGTESGDDELFEEAKRIVVQSGKASASLLQRRLRVGYARAARLLDMLQEQQIIGQGDGNKPRQVLVHSDESGSLMHSEGIEATAAADESDDSSQSSW